MHDLLYQYSPRLASADLLTIAAEIDLDIQRFGDDLATRRHMPRVREDTRVARPAACTPPQRSSSTAFNMRADTISKAFARRCSRRSTSPADVRAERVTATCAKHGFGSSSRSCARSAIRPTFLAAA